MKRYIICFSLVISGVLFFSTSGFSDEQVLEASTINSEIELPEIELPVIKEEQEVVIEPKQDVEAKKAPVETKIVNVPKNVINNQHSLDQIKYKISRAYENLKSFEGDLGEHGLKAMEYLNKALAELGN